jgi:ribosomal protein L37AE/L43A
MLVNTCPCCGSVLLRHARRKGVYWYCTSCHQEMMPLLTGQLPICPEPMKARSHTLQSLSS